MRFLKKIFIFLLFLFPFGEIIRFDFGNGFVIKPLDICIVILVLSWLLFKFFKKQRIKQKEIYFPTFLFALTGFFSLFINNLDLSLNELLTSISYLFRWISYVAIFFVVCDFDKKFKIVISKLLITIGSIIVVLGYVQYFFYNSLKNLFYLGWDEHMYRLFSVFLDPNFAGAFFVLFFLFLMSIFLKKKSILIGLLIILTLGTVFLTFSRSALIMLIATTSVLFMIENKKKWLTLLLGITLLVIVIPSKFTNIESINFFRIISSEARIKTAIKAIEIINQHPIFGVGFNAYRYAKLDHSSRNNNSMLVSHADAGVDNSFLFVIATTGIVGFIIYMLLWFRILKILSILGIVSVIGVFVDSMFINSLFYPFIMLWLWIILALSIKNHN